MAKKNKKPTNETAEIEKSDEVLSVVDTKKASKTKSKEDAKVSEKKAKQAKKKAKNDKPKKNFLKETYSELKKVNWPTFKKACKQTGTVLVVVAIFSLVILGIDSLVAWLLELIVKI